jgi:predicted MFS family arabinose efflux permease
VAGRARLIWRVAVDPSLRRIEIAYVGFSLAEHGTWLAVLVYAFSQGGVTETGMVATVLLVGAVVAAPFSAYAGDRFSPGRALSVGSFVQAVTMAGVAVAMWLEWSMAAYAAALALNMALTFSRPVVISLLPVITRRPSDLVAANVLIGLLTDLSLFLGPLTAAGLIAAGGPDTVMAVYAAVLVAGGIITIGIDGDAEEAAPSAPIDLRGLGSELLAGLRTLVERPSVRALVVLLFVAAIAGGVIDVLVVSFADLRLDGDGGSQAGVLAAGAGFGAVMGSVAASSLIGGSRSRWFLVIGGAAIAVPFALLAASGRLIVAVVLLAMVGAGQSMLAVAGSVAIQRRTPGDTLARVFGTVESAHLLAAAVGATVGAVLIDRLALGDALRVVSLTLAVLLAAAVVWLVRTGADAPPPSADIMYRLSEDKIFALADLPTLERLAHGAKESVHQPGDAVTVEGEFGDQYHLLVRGQVEVSVGGEVVRTMGPGSSFGEIALLRDVPRTASVTCISEVSLLSIQRDEFLEIVTGHPRRLATASEQADQRMRSVSDPPA